MQCHCKWPGKKTLQIGKKEASGGHLRFSEWLGRVKKCPGKLHREEDVLFDLSPAAGPNKGAFHFCSGSGHSLSSSSKVRGVIITISSLRISRAEATPGYEEPHGIILENCIIVRARPRSAAEREEPWLRVDDVDTLESPRSVTTSIIRKRLKSPT